MKTIISGGQTGVDQGALYAAKDLNYNTEGYMPKGFKTENGLNPEMATLFNLKEADEGYASRDKKNVDISDSLIAFLSSKPLTGKGSLTTLNYAITGNYEFKMLEKPDNNYSLINGKIPCLVIWDPFQDDFLSISLIQSFCKDKGRILYSGGCESTFPGIQEKTRELIVKALQS